MRRLVIKLHLTRGRILSLLKIAVSGGLIAILVRSISLESFAAGLRQVDVRLFLIALAVAACAMLIRSVRWQLLLRVQGVTISLYSAHILNHIGLFFNNFFLGSLGGDAYRAYKTMGQSSVKGGAVSAIIMERVSGVWGLVLVLVGSSVGIALVGDPLISRLQLVPVVAFGVVLLVLAWLFMRLAPQVKHAWVHSRFPKIHKMVRELADGLAVYRDSRGTVAVSTLLSVLFLLTNSVAMLLYVQAANAEIDFIQSAFLISISALVLILPITLNGIGLHEGVIFVFLSRVGLDPETALLVALYPRIGLVIFSLFGGILYAFSLGGQKASPKSV